MSYCQIMYLTNHLRLPSAFRMTGQNKTSWDVPKIGSPGYLQFLIDISITSGFERHYSISQAEILTIYLLAYLGLDSGYKNRQILILSDSQITLGILDSVDVNSKLVSAGLVFFRILSYLDTVEVKWVPKQLEDREG